MWCDNTHELLAATLRPGNAGSNTTADQIEVLIAAIAQVSAAHRKKLLVRADDAGASHALLDWLAALNTAPVHGGRGRSLEYSMGFALTNAMRDAITLVPKGAWSVALDTEGDVREHADVVELTGLLPASTISAWPAGMRVIVRREHPTRARPSPCSRAEHGWRYQAFVTNTVTGQVSFLEAPYRAHARVEARIRVAKHTGLGRLPSRGYRINQGWLSVVTIPADLSAWLALIALPDALKTCEPKALRYRFPHLPARLACEARQQQLRLPASWPRVTDAVATFTNVLAIPMRTWPRTRP